MKFTRTLLTALLLAPLTTLFAAQVVIEPKATTTVLMNPGKGWSVHASTPKFQEKEVLEFVGMGVRRFDWAALEPREGEYNWKDVEDTLADWGSSGRVCNLGVMCANTHSGQPGGYVTPKWVFDAGAKKIEMELTPDMATQGTPGHKVAPVFDDPIFLAKFRTFLQAFAKRFDGDPRIAVLDIRSYGNWGEAHMYPFKAPDIAPEKFREHVQMHLDAFKKTQLCLSRNSHLGKFGPLKEIYDWAVLEKHIAPRRDGICGNSDGKETAIGLGIAPGVFEFYADYDTLKKLGWWDGKKDKGGNGFKLEDCVENGHPSWVDMSHGKPALRLLQENRALVERLTNRMGYHFHLARAAWPSEVANGFELELSVQNKGVAPVYVPCAVAIALLDDKGQRIATTWPTGLQPKQWQPDQTTKQTASVKFNGMRAGNYQLALALTPKAGEAKPYIKLGTELPTVDGWYVLGKVSVK